MGEKASGRGLFAPSRRRSHGFRSCRTSGIVWPRSSSKGIGSRCWEHLQCAAMLCCIVPSSRITGYGPKQNLLERLQIQYLWGCLFSLGSTWVLAHTQNVRTKAYCSSAMLVKKKWACSMLPSCLIGCRSTIQTLFCTIVLESLIPNLTCSFSIQNPCFLCCFRFSFGLAKLLRTA